jgi:molecular chaperone DnaK
MVYHKIIGIDLGTTFSVVSAFNDETGKPEAFEVPGMQPPRCIFPSVVSVSRQGKILVGWPAKRNLPANPQNTVIEVKRYMGDERENELGGQKFNPQTISAMVLTELKKIAEARIGEPVHDAVITVPAYFNDLRRKATEDAARIAQLNPRLLINEPTAAAIAYGLDRLTDDERIFIVYDLGGGTFDVSVISVTGTTIEVMGTAGDDRLGGGDFDDRLTEWVFTQLERDYPGSGALINKPELKARVKAAAEQAKIDLSGNDFAVVEVPNLTSAINLYYEIDRNAFVELLQEPRPRPGHGTMGLLDQTIASVSEAFESAKHNFKERLDRVVTMDDVSEILLVGGSTRIPIIKEMLEKKFGKSVRFDPEIVDKAVSMGAAIMGRTMDPMDKFEGEVVTVPREVGEGLPGPAHTAIAQLGVIDVTGHSLGIMLLGDRFHRLINKDTELPCEITHNEFTTAAEGQTVVRIAVFQGEDPIAPNNTLLGELLIDGLPPRPIGYHLFDVTFTLNISGVLNLKVKQYVLDNTQPPQEYTRELKSDGVKRLSKEEVEANRQRIQNLMEQGFGSPGVFTQSAGAWQPPFTPPPFTTQGPYAPGSQQPQPNGPNQPPATPWSNPVPTSPPVTSQPTSAAPAVAEAPASTTTAPVADSDMAAKIPPEYRDVWTKARAHVANLQGARAQILQTSIKFFEDAVQAGNPVAIADYAKAMVETYFSSLH